MKAPQMISKIVLCVTMVFSLSSSLHGQTMYCYTLYGLNTAGMSPFYEPVCGKSNLSYDQAQVFAEMEAKGKGLSNFFGWEDDCNSYTCRKNEMRTLQAAITPTAANWKVAVTIRCTNGITIPPVHSPGDSFCSAFCEAKKAAYRIAQLSGCCVSCCTYQIVERPVVQCCPVCRPVCR
jgi:hypothetical protein